MKKFLLLTLISILIFFSLTLTSRTFASEHLQTDNHILLSKDKVIKSDYFAAGESVTLDGTVNGDAYLIGGKITVNGTVKGDLIVGGGDLNLRGKVEGNIRAVGGQIIITSLVGKNVTVAGGTVNLSDTAKIGGNLVAGAGNMNLYSEVTGDLTAGAGQLTIGNKIGNEVNVGVGNLTIASTASVLGNVNYWSKEDARVETGSQISGQISKFMPKELPAKTSGENLGKFFAGFFAVYKLLSILSAFIIGIIFIKLAPVYTQNTINLISEKPLQTLGVGFLGLAVSPVLIITLLITVIGIPLSLILLASFFILIYLSKIIVAIFIGQKVVNYLKRQTNLVWALILGLFAYLVLTSIPILGALVTFIAIIFGLGALITERYRFYQLLREKKLI